MIKYEKIRHVHLEISSRCNARCPDCPRNLFGVNVVDHYPQCDLRLADIKKIFKPEFLSQLTDILICGNYGDFVTARDAVEIVEYFYQENPTIRVKISTNASARPDIWPKLANTKAEVRFRIDGLQDTHHLYRVDTDWDLIMSNAKSFIQNGGNASWYMIVFDHNRHQIDQCRELSQSMGFRDFKLVEEEPGVRNRFPVFGRDKELKYVVGGYSGNTDFAQLKQDFFERDRHLDAAYSKPAKTIKCKAVVADNYHSIYISSNGEVYPCCWLGFYPLTNDTRLSNLQLRPLIKNNNALTHDLRTAIDWFSAIEKSWSIPIVQQGRIDSCNSVCGSDN